MKTQRKGHLRPGGYKVIHKREDKNGKDKMKSFAHVRIGKKMSDEF